MFNQVLGKFSPAWKRACTDLYSQMEDAELQISANSNKRDLTKEKLKEIKGKAVRKLDTVACRFIRKQRILNDIIPVLSPPPKKKKWVNAFTISVWPCVWAQSLSLVRLFTTQWTIACQAPLSMGFPRQEYWSGWPFPSPEHLPDPEIEPVYPVLAGGFYTTEPPGKPSSLALNFPKLSESPVSQQYGTHEGKFYSLLIWGQAWNSKHIQNQKHIFLKLYLQMNAIKEIYLWRVS